MGYFDWILDYNGVPTVSDARYLKYIFSIEAMRFIARNSHKTFFLHLAYNAPRAPFEAPETYIDFYRQFESFNEGVCRIYAMIQKMDDGIGRVLEALCQHGLENNSIVLFTCDNGPLLKKMGRV